MTLPQITVRPLIDSDYTIVANWLMDKEINRWLYAEWRDREISDKLIAITSKGKKNRMWMGLVNDQPYCLVAVGNISLVDRSGIAWYLRGSKVKRRAGVMTNCVALALTDAFSTLGLHSISASIQAGNISSERLLKSVGFKQVGVLRQAFYVNNKFIDRVQYDLLEQDLNYNS